MRTPTILFTDTGRIKAPSVAEALLLPVGSHAPEGVPFITDAGSFFTAEAQATGNCNIPPDIHYPLSFNEPLPSGKIGGHAIQVFRSGEKIQPETELIIMANASEMLAHPKELAERITSLRLEAGFGRLIYAPGTGLPSHIATLTYCGVDIFDSIPLVLAARAGKYLFSSNALHRDDAAEIPCHCPSCHRREIGDSRGFEDILLHNCYSAMAELKNVRNAIARGTLRELAEYRSRATPEMTALLRHMDIGHYDYQEALLPVARYGGDACGPGIWAAGKESLSRPEIARFRQRVQKRWRKSPNTSVLLLLPCSARKPYSLSKTHRAFRDVLMSSGNPWAVQEVIVTSPLGLVPRELETFYPANCYDIPVTGHWDRDEIHMITSLIEQILEQNRFERAVIALSEEMDFVKEAVERSGVSFSSACVCGKKPSSIESLELLASRLSEALDGVTKIDSRTRMQDDVLSMARFQFDEPSGGVVDGAEIRGRFPHVKLFKNGKQVAMYSPDRDMFALTPEGASVLMREKRCRVLIADFKPHGDIMVVGVKGADPDIRIGDEVAITSGDGSVLIGTGIAKMSALQMTSERRGVAVKTRQICKT